MDTFQKDTKETLAQMKHDENNSVASLPCGSVNALQKLIQLSSWSKKIYILFTVKDTQFSDTRTTNLTLKHIMSIPPHPTAFCKGRVGEGQNDA